MKKQKFTQKIFLDQDQNRVMRKRLQKIKEESSGEYEKLIRYYVKNNRLNDLYEQFHWNYILPLEGKDPYDMNLTDCKGIAVIVFLYYMDTRKNHSRHASSTNLTKESLVSLAT